MAPPSVKFPPSLSFAGQAVLVTGANTGLGLETAIHYVQLGASPVIITARNTARGDEAVATIEARTGKKGVVQARTLDMSSFSNVKKFVDDLKNEVKSIDIILLNAGCFSVDCKPSPDGWEEDLQVNTLSTTLLALLLLPWMQSVKQPGKQQHLGIVGSGNHTRVDILAKEWPKQDILKYFNDKKNYKGGPQAYGTSKLLVQYAANEITELAVDSDGRYAWFSPLSAIILCYLSIHLIANTFLKPLSNRQRSMPRPSSYQPCPKLCRQKHRAPGHRMGFPGPHDVKPRGWLTPACYGGNDLSGGTRKVSQALHD